MTTEQDRFLTDEQLKSSDYEFKNMQKAWYEKTYGAPYGAQTQDTTTEANKRIAELQAHINVLREALKMSSKSLEAIDFDWECEHGFHQDKCPNPVCEVKEYWDAIAISKKALASTPAQHINNDEVIERCAKVCESLKEQDYCVDVRAGAEAIRALKGTA